MVVTLRPRAITVDRGSRGFGLSLIYRGLDKYEEKDTGIFVARVVPGGNSYTNSYKCIAYICILYISCVVGLLYILCLSLIHI